MYQQQESSAIRLTLAEYRALEAASERKWEYLDGEAWCLAGGSNTHSLICANIIGELRAALRPRGKCCVVHTSDAKVKLSQKRHLYPDVTVSCDARDREHNAFLSYPCVVVEVLSRSTQSKDRGPKLLAYQNLASLQEIVLVSSRLLRIAVYHRQAEGGNLWTYEVISGTEGALKLASLGVEHPFSAIYADTMTWGGKGSADINEVDEVAELEEEEE